MLKINQRYLASNFIAPFILSTVFFVVFLLTFQLFRITRIVINKGVSVDIVLELVMHIAVSFLPMAIPLSALFASIYTLNKMSEDSEIVAMRSFGVSKWSLCYPFMLMGVFLSLSIFMLNINLIPMSKTKFKNTIIKLTSRGMLTNIKAGNFFTRIPGVTLFAEEVDETGKKLKDVYINQSNKEKGTESIILAKRGSLIKKTMGKWGVPTLRLHLEDGNIVKTKVSGNTIEKIVFKEYDFPIISGGSLNSLVSKASMKSNNELSKVIALEQKEFDETPKNKRSKGMIKSLMKLKLEYWSRFNTPIQCLVFIFLGFGLGIKKGRGRGKSTGLAGILVLIGYYVLFFVGVTLARKGMIAPVLVVFFPSVISFIVGLRFYKKIDWAS